MSSKPKRLSDLRSILLLVACAWSSTPAGGAVKRYVTPTPEQIETELLELINRDRQRLGREPLLPHPLLQEIARGHSGKMAAERQLSHGFPGWPALEQRMQQGNLCFLASAENVARGQTPFARFIHEALVASFRHRVNILDGRMLQAGIGVCRSGNEYFVTEEFAAIVECPVPEAAMVMIENELARWHQERFAVVPVIQSAARLPARVSAQQYLLGTPLDLRVLSAKGMHGVSICYNDMATILAELKKEICRSPVSSLTVGVAWGRNLSFPGGAYSVCVFFFN